MTRIAMTTERSPRRSARAWAVLGMPAGVLPYAGAGQHPFESKNRASGRRASG